MDHFGLASILARRSGAEVAALGRAGAVPGGLRQRDRPRRRLRRGASCCATASRAKSSPRCAPSRPGFRAWGSAVEVTRPLARRRASCELRDRTLRVLHRPGHSPSDTVFLDEAAADAARRRPPDRAHLLQPAARAPARRRARSDRTAAAGAGHVHATRWKRRARWSSTLVLPGHGRPITDHVALIDERFRMHRRRAEQDPPPDRRAAAHRARDRAGAVGQRRRHAGLPDAVGGARPRRPAARRRPRRRGRGATASCASSASAALAPAPARSRPGARRSRGRRRSALGSPANQASRISPSSASEVLRRLSASTLASFQRRAPAAVAASAQSAARTPATLLAAIDAPVPVQQHTIACSARPSATSRAAASEAHAQSSRSSVGERAVRERLVAAAAQLLGARAARRRSVRLRRRRSAPA